MKRLTKTFIESRWYRRTTAGKFVSVPPAEEEATLPLDDQVKNWVDATDSIIIHPGQLGMHTTWHGSKKDPYQLKCVTLGLTVLYQESGHGGQSSQRSTIAAEHADISGVDPGAGVV